MNFTQNKTHSVKVGPFSRKILAESLLEAAAKSHVTSLVSENLSFKKLTPMLSDGLFVNEFLVY